MLTIAAVDTLAGVAQTASKVTCTIFGMELNAGVEVYKALAQLQLAAAAATIYNAPASTTSFVKSIAVVNTDAVNPQTFQLFRGGTAAANAITPIITIPAGGMAVYEDGYGWDVLTAAGIIQSVITASRANMAADAKGWQFLGSATAAATTIGPVIWTGTFQQIMIKYIIKGYNGGTPVGRALFGAASISTTALTNGSNLSETATGTAQANSTSAPSIPGCPLAVTLSAIARAGTIMIDGASGSLKTYEVYGQNGAPAVATPPSIFRAAGSFSDLGTNLPLQRAQLSVYDTLVATALSAQAFLSGSYLAVWGRNTD